MQCRTLLAPAAALCLSVFAGCGEETPKSEKAASRSGLVSSEETRDWLGPKDGVEPEHWLAQHTKAPGDKNEQAIKSALVAASGRFGEDVRMIANRAVQLETMLAPMGADNESALMLLQRLTVAVGLQTRVEGFGAVGQHYFNLRKSGLSSAAAASEIEKHYGAHG